jgi:hypothetical protein
LEFRRREKKLAAKQIWEDFPRWQLRYRSRKPNLGDSKTSLRSWSHTWVILTASSQNNNRHHTRCRKKFKDRPTNQPLIAPNSCNQLHSQQGGSRPGETLLHHADFFFFPPSSRNKAPTRIKPSTPWTSILGKDSPQHVTLKKFGDCHYCCSCRHLHQTCLWDIWHTKQVSAVHHAESPQSSPG